MKTNFSSFLLWITLLMSYQKNLCLAQNHKIFLRLLCLGFLWSIIHFELISQMVWDMDWSFFVIIFGVFFVYRHLIVPVPFVVKTTLSPLTHLSVLLKINYHIYVSLFLDSLFWSMIFLSFSMPILYCLDNCNFIVSIINNK